MRIARFILPSLTLLTSLALPARASTPMPGWLAGTWMREAGAAWAEQMWTMPRDDQMLGLARTGFGPGVTGWDYVRIELTREGRPELVTQPKGKDPVRYPVAVTSDNAIEFANPAAAFPQRLRYWREGQLLMLEVSRMDGSEAERWNFRPVASPVD
jgi:hypothetical protein